MDTGAFMANHFVRYIHPSVVKTLGAPWKYTGTGLTGLWFGYPNNCNWIPSRGTRYYFLTFVCPCIASIFAEYNQQDATFLNLFISVRRSTCFRRGFPSSGAQNCAHSVRYLSDQYCYLLLFWLAAGSNIGLTNTWRFICSFELLIMDGKPVWNM